jgi:hypothetical protein
MPSLSRKIKLHARVDNQTMRKIFLKNAAAIFFSVLGLSACQPSLNWRNVQMPETTLSFELPCKPDKTTKPVSMAGQTLELSVVGCEAGDAVWAVMSAKLSADADRTELLKGWRQATLQNMRANQIEDATWMPARMTALPGALRLKAIGTTAKGEPVRAHAVWFAHLEGDSVRVVHAVVYQNQGHKKDLKQDQKYDPKQSQSADLLIESMKLP